MIESDRKQTKSRTTVFIPDHFLVDAGDALAAGATTLITAATTLAAGATTLTTAATAGATR
jgi:hypothetical protein